MAKVADDMADCIGSHGVIQRAAHRALYLACAPWVHQGQPAALVGARQLCHVIACQSCKHKIDCHVV